MTRSLIVNGLAMFFGLGLALWVWTAGDVQEDPKAVLLNWQPEQITHLEYMWPKGQSVVDYDAKDKQATVTLSVESQKTKKPTPKSVQAKEDAGGAEDAALVKVAESESKTITTKTVFPAGSITLRAIDALAPLQASHDLGALSSEQLAKLGLDKVERRLLIRGPQAERVLELGKKSYGGRGVYGRLQGEKNVYLIPASVSAGFEGPAGKLMESRILPIKAETVSAVSLTVAAQQQRFVQVEGKQKGQRYYALATSPENKSDEATTLISRLYGLRAVKYLQEPPARQGMNELGKIKIERKDAPPMLLTIFERLDGQGYVVARGRWFAELRSAQLRPLLDDLTALLSESGQ